MPGCRVNAQPITCTGVTWRIDYRRGSLQASIGHFDQRLRVFCPYLVARCLDVGWHLTIFHASHLSQATFAHLALEVRNDFLAPLGIDLSYEVSVNRGIQSALKVSTLMRLVDLFEFTETLLQVTIVPLKFTQMTSHLTHGLFGFGFFLHRL